MTARVGIIGLAEAGNLGDDLIAVAVMQTIAKAIAPLEVQFLSFGRTLNWEGIFEALDFECEYRRRRPSRDLPMSKHDLKLLSTCDAVVFGGGGLLQTTHHPQRPYGWLRFVPPANLGTPVIAVGLGIGPLNRRWVRRLAKLGMPFDECFLRDDDSLALAADELGWPAKRCRDFVDPQFLSQFPPSMSASREDRGNRSLGVALRDWPGLDAGRLSSHIDRVATETKTDHIRFFVLEANPKSPDIPFTRAVMEGVKVAEKVVELYDPHDLVNFVGSMSECDAAISMKLHSSAVWSAASVPVFPILYAPKTAAFFGVPYAGLEVFSEATIAAPEDSAPRAQDVLASWLIQQRMCQHSVSTRASLTRVQRVRCQFRSLVSNVGTRLTSRG